MRKIAAIASQRRYVSYTGRQNQPDWLGITLLSILLLSATTSCNSANSSSQSQEGEAPSQSEQVEVVTTFLPMYWFTKAVAGSVAKVEILVPPGTEVHEYQATPANVQAIAQADVLVKNGLGLEEFLDDTVKNAGNSQLKQIDASKGIQALKAISPIVNTNASEQSHEHGAGNPHVWLDPVLVKQQVANIRNGLIAADPKNKATYLANATAYIQQFPLRQLA